MPVTFTTRIEEELAEAIDSIAAQEGMDRSTVIRRFLRKAAKEWRIEESLQDYEGGKITLWQAAARCHISVWEMVEEARRREIHVPYTLQELREDLEGLQSENRSV